MLAVRRYGKGRIAYLAVPAAYHVVGGMAPAHERIFLQRGLKELPSDGERLIASTLNWLAEHARASKDFGGAFTEKEAITIEPFRPPPLLKKPVPFREPRRGLHGVLAALSPRSCGQDSVPAFAAKAKALGLDFIVVVDDVMDVDAAAFKKLNEEAEAACTNDFKCIPGLRFRDEVGNRYIAFRRGLRYPTPDMLTGNHRFYTVIRKGGRFSGTGGLGLSRWVQANGHHMAIVYYRDQRDLNSDDPYEYGTPPWDIRPYRQFHSVFTYDESGTRIDDMVDEHKVVVDDGQHPHPVAITFIKRAADLEKVASGELPHTVWLNGPLSALPSNTGEAPNYLPTSSYATEGPVILRWQWDSRDIESNGNYWDWTRMYQRWALAVESPAGLDRVEVWDGVDLVRRWPLDGKKRFEKIVYVNKHQLTMPLLIVVDGRGRRALSAGFQWKSHNFYVSWCSDRVNTLSYSALPSKYSSWGSSAGTWPLCTQPKGPLWDNLRLDINLDVLRFPGYDGQPSGGAVISPNFYIMAAAGQHSDGRLYRHISWPMASQEAVIQQSTFRHQLLPEQSGPHAWSTLGPIRPTGIADATLRYTTFVHYGDQPAPVIVEGELRFKKDVRTDPKRYPLRVAQISAHRAEAGYRGVAVRHTGKRDHVYPICYDDRDVQGASGEFPPMAYVWYYPSRFGPMGVIAFSEGLHYRLSNRPRNRATLVYWGEKGHVFRAGDVVRWKYIAVTSRFNDLSGTDTPERIIDLMGIDGSPGYKVEVMEGKVLDTHYVLSMESAKGQAGIRVKLEPSDEARRHGLPVALPLTVSHMNPRWTSLLWIPGQRTLRPLPVAEGKTFAHLKDLRAPITFFIGHPFVCNDPDIFLTAIQTGASSLWLYAHNPTREHRSVRVRRAEGFDFPASHNSQGWNWVLPPGGEKGIHVGPLTPWSPENAME